MQKISMVVDFQEQIVKTCGEKKILSWKWPQANPNPNPNPNPKLNPRVRVGVNSW